MRIIEKAQQIEKWNFLWISGWYEMDVRVELLADDIWEVEDDKTGFLSVGVDIFDWIYLK